MLRRTSKLDISCPDDGLETFRMLNYSGWRKMKFMQYVFMNGTVLMHRFQSGRAIKALQLSLPCIKIYGHLKFKCFLVAGKVGMGVETRSNYSPRC